MFILEKVIQRPDSIVQHSRYRKAYCFTDATNLSSSNATFMQLLQL
jgi:hypothetical protein